MLWTITEFNRFFNGCEVYLATVKKLLNCVRVYTTFRIVL
nr:hypothetical protein HWPLAUVJ_HWPLAUVJ_CDS_0005 [Microvirus sp.]